MMPDMEHNRQGREVSESMRLREFKRFLVTQPKPRPFTPGVYRGYTVEGIAGKWFVTGDPRIFTSKAKAYAAIDFRIQVREEVAAAGGAR